MLAPAALLDLVARFRAQLPDYKRGQYNETQLRRDFLDPLFRLLGWDVDNRAGYAESFREVVHEDAVKVGGATKAPDYSFRLGGRRLFFLEAKKPSVCIKEDVAPAYQLRRYAWSAGLQLSILSDFEEFAVYDGSVKPGAKDKPAKARVFYCTFEDYAAKWDEIAALFAKDAVLKGGLERFVKKLHEQLAAARTAHDKTLIQRQCEATDRQIDALVYELYGLTTAEIALVEGGAP